jgi:hypothetical protein
VNTGKLFISFGHIGLENLPEGTFAHRKITPDDARLRIERARETSTLQCVSDDDLVAPYHEEEREHHDALCRVLGEHYGITLSLKEFFVKDDAEDGGSGLYTIFALQFAQVGEEERLLVVTCGFTLRPKEERKPGALDFARAPSSVEFHLIEAA